MVGERVAEVGFGGAELLELVARDREVVPGIGELGAESAELAACVFEFAFVVEVRELEVDVAGVHSPSAGCWWRWNVVS